MALEDNVGPVGVSTGVHCRLRLFQVRVIRLTVAHRPLLHQGGLDRKESLSPLRLLAPRIYLG